ncbi:MAG: DUF4097 family beta strand repeat protein [Xanthomonadales bacterium]|nr:DUF4097 family beta strand repeat protein [Xanthomonadales bacterium]
MKTCRPLSFSRTAVAVMVALATPGIALASKPIDEVRPISATGEVRIDNQQGSIRVIGSDRTDVRISGSLGEGVEELEIDGDSGKLRIDVDYPDGGSWSSWFGGQGRVEDTDLVIEVPRTVKLRIDSISATVDVEEVFGASISVDSISGSVTVRGGAEEIDVDSVSGSVDVRSTAAARFDIESVSGDVEIEATGQAERVNVETVSGSARVSGPPALRTLQASTVSGRLDLEAGIASGGSFQLEAMSGDVHLTVPAATSATLRVESFSGNIRSSHGTVQKEEYGPGRSLETTLGKGGARIDIEAFSGDVRFDMR